MVLVAKHDHLVSIFTEIKANKVHFILQETPSYPQLVFYIFRPSCAITKELKIIMVHEGQNIQQPNYRQFGVSP
jgi:hypothetical protein